MILELLRQNELLKQVTEHFDLAEVGKLGLQVPSMESTQSNCFNTRATLQFSKLLDSLQSSDFKLSKEDSEKFPELLPHIERLEQKRKELHAITSEILTDSRVKALDGKMISCGSSSISFNAERLAAWYLWRANEVGLTEAKDSLNTWLDNEEIETVCALWINGVTLDEEIILNNSFRISPAASLPDSTDKERAIQARLSFEMPVHPSVAITRVSRIRKAHDPDDIIKESHNKAFRKDMQRLYDIATVLNVLPSITCTPVFATSYSLPHFPYGPFGGSGGGRYYHDVAGSRYTTLRREQQSDIESALHDFDQLDDKQRLRFQHVLNRLSQAKRRDQIEDKILDLAIAAEMLLLDSPSDQLAQSFRLRGAWLVSASPVKRKENYKLLKNLYSYRSQVAHTGLLEGGKLSKIEAVREDFSKFQSLVENICRKLLQRPKLDWDDIVLNAVTPET